MRLRFAPALQSKTLTEQSKGSERKFKQETQGELSCDHARRGLKWLAEIDHPLDWNGPPSRQFCKFRAEDLDLPIIDYFARVTRPSSKPDRGYRFRQVALFCGMMVFLGLAEIIEAKTRPGDLIGIALPT
jgi:hypothetical protein